MRTSLGGLVLALCSIYGCSRARDRPTSFAASGDSEGVRIVHIAPLSSIDVPEWRGEILWSTKDLDGHGVELSSVSYGLFLPSGALVLANAGASELLMLDSAGTSVRHVGREGRGPGEFEWPGRLIPVGAGQFCAWDVKLGRLSFFDAAGEFERAQLVEFGEPLTVLADGGVLAARPDEHRFPAKGEWRDTVPLVRTGPHRAMDTVGLWAGLEKHFAEGRSGRLMMPIGFGRSTYYASNGSNTIISSTDSLDLTEYSRSVRPVLRLVAPPDPRHPDEADRAAWREQVLDDVTQNSHGDPAFQAAFLTAYRAALEQDPTRGSYPGFAGLALDAAGRIWVGEYPEPGVRMRRWIILNPKGKPVGQLHLPLRFSSDGGVTELLATGRDRIAVLRVDSLSVQTVEVWRVTPDP